MDQLGTSDGGPFMAPPAVAPVGCCTPRRTAVLGARPNNDIIDVTGTASVTFAEFAVRAAAAWK